MRLLSQTELFNNCTVAVDVCLLKVAKKVSSVTYHLLETSAAVVILVVALEVLCKGLDSLCEKCDLHLGRTCVALVGSISLDNCLLFVFLHHGCFHLSVNYSSLTQKSAGEMSLKVTIDPIPVQTAYTILYHDYTYL